MSAKLKWKDARGVREGVEMTERFFLIMMRHAHKDVLAYKALHLGGAQWAHGEYVRHRSQRMQWMSAIRQLRECTRRNAKDVVNDRHLARIRAEREEKFAGGSVSNAGDANAEVQAGNRNAPLSPSLLRVTEDAAGDIAPLSQTSVPASMAA